VVVMLTTVFWGSSIAPMQSGFSKNGGDDCRSSDWTLHPDKTRLIEFGRFASNERKERGKGKPETLTSWGSRTFVDRLGRTANSSCCARPSRSDSWPN